MKCFQFPTQSHHNINNKDTPPLKMMKIENNGKHDVFVTLYHYLRLTGDSILIQTEFRGHFASCCAVMIKHNIAWSRMEIRNSACCGELSNVKKQSRESDAADEMNQSWCKEL